MKRLLAFPIALAILTLAACSDRSTGPADAPALKATAWELYSAFEYQAAEATFREALRSAPNDGEALTGQGWSLIYMRNLGGAIQVLPKVRPSDSTWYVAAQAGLAVAYDADGQFHASLNAATVALTLDSAWVFFHTLGMDGDSPDWRDLEYLRAKNSLMLGAQADPLLETARAALERIDDSAPLDPMNPSSWTAGDAHYATLVEAVLKRVELAAR
jgi:tetratricopeptide (TPR) repeat protein